MEKAGSGRMGKCLERRWWAGSFLKKSSSGEQTRFRPAGRPRFILSLRRGIWGQMSLYRMPRSAAAASNRGERPRLWLDKRLVHAKPLPDRACAARIPRWAYPLDNRLKNRRKRMWAAQGRRPGSAVCGRVWPVRCFLCSGRKQPRFPRCPEQAPRAAWHTLCFTGIADMPCPV